MKGVQRNAGERGVGTEECDKGGGKGWGWGGVLQGERSLRDSE